jgi:ribosomal-protein-alanine N-acetyltransferase
MRPMTPADVDEVLAIEQTVQAYPWTRGNFMDALSSGYVCSVDAEELVGGQPEQGGKIRSYAVLMPVLEEAELLNIGVAMGQQRKGLGRAMLSAMLDEACARNIIRVFLEVRASNAAALALYGSAGFVRIGVRRGYYPNAGGGEDAVTMACELTGEINEQA